MSRQDIEFVFPDLISSGYCITSPFSTDYNCIAWAANDDEAWWWPDSQYQYYWPPNIPREETVDAFTLAYKSLGFEVCDNPLFEDDCEKIAIYTKNGIPTHAARQLPSEKWTSKLGRLEDIEHKSLKGIAGFKYGNNTVYMKRKRK